MFNILDFAFYMICTSSEKRG